MSYICILYILLLVFFCYRSERSFFSPSVSFTLLYLLIFTLSAFGWFGIYKAPDIAYLLITLGVSFFVVGTFVRNRISPNHEGNDLITLVGQNEGGCLKAKTYWGLLSVLLVIISISAAVILFFLL